ncbi:MAG: hypothetical protein ACPGVZ_20335 [Myxococcota bacterium]
MELAKRWQAPTRSKLLARRFRPQLGTVLLLAIVCAQPRIAFADVEYDGLLSGRSGEIPVFDGSAYVVPADHGTLVEGDRATNLFHGFRRLELDSGIGLVFEDGMMGPIDHLIVRVASSDGASTRIDGTLTSEIPGASLFLLDANGVFVGPSGSILADGALYLSTASALLDDEGARLDVAIDPASAGEGCGDACLLRGVPSLLEFSPSLLGDSEDDLKVEGDLLALGNPRPNLGPDAAWDGNVHLSGRRISIKAPAGGRLEIRAGADAVDASSVGDVLAIAVGDTGSDVPTNLDQFDPIAHGLDGNATLTISGSALLLPVPIPASDTEAPPRRTELLGRVVLRGGRLVTEGDGNAIPVLTSRGGRTVEAADPAPAPGEASPLPAIDLRFSEEIELGRALLRTTSLSGSPVEEVGPIRLEAPSIEINPGTRIQALPNGENGGGDIEIRAESLLVDSASITGTGVSNCADSESCGAVGHVLLEADAIELRGVETEISVSTDDLRNAGELTLRAREQILLDGSGAALDGDRFPGLFARSGVDANGGGGDASSVGNAGRITIEAPNVSIRGGAQVSAAVFAERGGEGGQIEIAVGDQLSIEGSIAENVASQVTAESNSTASNVGGQITIRGLEDSVDGPRSVRLLENGRISTTSTGRGPAGAISIAAGTIELKGNAAISTESGLAASGGEAADIDLRATDDLLLREGSRVSSTSNGDVAPGAIRLEAGRRLEVTGGSRLLARALRDTGEAPAEAANPEDLGNVFLTAGQTVRLVDAEIETNTRRAASGSVEILSGNSIEVFSSTIQTEVDRADGAGGDIDLASTTLVVNDSLLSADARGRSANAGNLTLAAPLALVVDAASELSANAELGLSGDITVRAPDNDLFSALERIERRGDEPGAQIVDPCEISRREQGSFRTQGLRARRRSPEDDYQWRKGPLDPSAAARACGGDGVDDPNSP